MLHPCPLLCPLWQIANNLKNIKLKCQEPVSYDLWRIGKQHIPCVAAWGGVQNFVTVKNYIFLTGNVNSCSSRLCE